jgi:large subunit ribosomal protein L3
VALGLIGRNLGMTQLFSRDGEAIPITVIEAGPCSVVQLKSKEKEGYNALQLGFLPKKINKVNKPLQGHFKKSGTSAFYFLKEFKVDDTTPYQLEQEINLEIFQVGQKVTVTGISKGKGFSGGMKRWGFRGGPDSHGSTRHRAPGSIGCSAFPSRVFKGKKLPGHQGAIIVTIENLEIVDLQPGKNLLFLKGSVPGKKNTMVIIKPSKKAPANPAVKK